MSVKKQPVTEAEPGNTPVSIDAFHSPANAELQKKRSPFLKLGVLLGALMISATSCDSGTKNTTDRDAFFPQNDSAVQVDSESNLQPDDAVEEDNAQQPDADQDYMLQPDTEETGNDDTIDINVPDEDASDGMIDIDVPDEDTEESPDADDGFNVVSCPVISPNPHLEFCYIGYNDAYAPPGMISPPNFKVVAYTEKLDEYTPSADCDRMLGYVTVYINSDSTHFKWPMRVDWVKVPARKLLMPTLPKRMLDCLKKPSGYECDNYIRRTDPTTANCNEDANYSMLHARRLYYINGKENNKVFEGVLCSRGDFEFTVEDIGKVFPLVEDTSGRKIRVDNVEIDASTYPYSTTLTFSLLNKDDQVLQTVSHKHDSSEPLTSTNVAINDITLEGFDPATGSSYKYIAKDEGPIGLAISFCIEDYPWNIYVLQQNFVYTFKDREGRPIDVIFFFKGYGGSSTSSDIYYISSQVQY
ncbi:MAG: hypothetical protein QXU54_03650 [Candidatus Micrarchaeia archaeon]